MFRFFPASTPTVEKPNLVFIYPIAVDGECFVCDFENRKVKRANFKLLAKSGIQLANCRPVAPYTKIDSLSKSIPVSLASPQKPCTDIDELATYLKEYLDKNAHHQVLSTIPGKPATRGLYLFDGETHTFIHQSGRKSMNPQIDPVRSLIVSDSELPLDYFHITHWKVKPEQMLLIVKAFFSFCDPFDWIPPKPRTIANALPWFSPSSVAVLSTPLSLSREAIFLPTGVKTTRWELQTFEDFTAYLAKKGITNRDVDEIMLGVKFDFPEVGEADLLLFITSYVKSFAM